MAGTRVSEPAGGVGRLGTIAAWTSAVACLPYLFLKVAWTLHLPVGVTDRSMLDSDAWVAGNAVMAGVQLVAVVLVVALVRPWSRRVPTWLLLFPVWVGTGLLFQLVVGVVLSVLSAPVQDTSAELGGIAPWVYVLVYAAFVVQGVALAVAFACHVRARWGRLLGEPTGCALARSSTGPQVWPHTYLAELAQVLAALAALVAVVCSYWAAGGAMGLSDAREPDSFGIQAARAAGAVLAAAGLLGLAGRWARPRPFWLPVALTWVGSGALVAFDALTVVVNRLVQLGGTPPPEAEWAAIDTVLLVKIVVGVLAAAVGASALTAASRAASPLTS